MRLTFRQTHLYRFVNMEVTPGFEPGNQGFADPCLTTWLCHHYIVQITGRECLLRIPQMKQFVKSIFMLKRKKFWGL